MVDTIYSMSFTTATLLYHESMVLANLYLQISDWGLTRDIVVRDNLLQMRTENASRRICREGISRLRKLSPSQLDIIREGSRKDRLHMLWLAVCKRYRFIHDFASEVVREKYLRLDLELTKEDYEIFFNSKAEWHPEMDRIADSTRKKQRQFVFKMMREADLLSSDNRILPALLSPTIIDAIGADDPLHFTVFPVSDRNIQEWGR